MVLREIGTVRIRIEIEKVEIRAKGKDGLCNPAGLIKKMIQLSVTNDLAQ